MNDRAGYLYLGNKCEALDTLRPWEFWMIMLMSGNMDSLAALQCAHKMSSKQRPETLCHQLIWGRNIYQSDVGQLAEWTVTILLLYSEVEVFTISTKIGEKQSIFY
ncbi:hypothetical protein VNO77_28051 [Canavalia gladiata]|uniref:DUF7705 domain-containing protein n=1 Tax=Canavalia gladiata TaxID=3824 RepID=A0AAN9KVR9_CANGL